jgi:hypothetical protein
MPAIRIESFGLRKNHFLLGVCLKNRLKAEDLQAQ